MIVTSDRRWGRSGGPASSDSPDRPPCARGRGGQPAPGACRSARPVGAADQPDRPGRPQGWQPRAAWTPRERPPGPFPRRCPTVRPGRRGVGPDRQRGLLDLVALSAVAASRPLARWAPWSSWIVMLRRREAIGADSEQ